MLSTTSSARRVLPAALTLAVAGCVLLGAGIALAGPAAALDDPRRPRAEVTFGPSCGPGAVRVLVTNGSEPHRVSLVFDGGPEQDATVLGAAEQAELVSADVAWGVTVDVSIAVADLDGTAEEPLRLDTYTRPSADDCAAISAPVTTPPAVVASPSGELPPATTPRSGTTAPVPAGTGTPAPPPLPGGPVAVPVDVAAADVGAGPSTAASASPVSPGGVVTVRATGFTPGEVVTVSIAGLDEPLTTVTAAADGSVEAVVQIPRGAALGTASVRFTGGASAAMADLDLQVAARTQPVSQPAGSPAVVAAGLALTGAAGTLGLVGARRSRGRHSTTSR